MLTRLPQSAWTSDLQAEALRVRAEQVQGQPCGNFRKARQLPIAWGKPCGQWMLDARPAPVVGPSAGQVRQARWLLPKHVFLIPQSWVLEEKNETGQDFGSAWLCDCLFRVSLYSFLTLKMRTFGLEKWPRCWECICSFRWFSSVPSTYTGQQLATAQYSSPMESWWLRPPGALHVHMIKTWEIRERILKTMFNHLEAV